MEACMVDPLNERPEKAKSHNKTTLAIIVSLLAVFVVLCGLVALGIIYVVERPYFGPKTQIILEPDPSRVTTVDRTDLEAAAEILTARCRSLGISSCSFVATKNNQILGQVPS